MWQKVGVRMKHGKEWYTCDRCGEEIASGNRSLLSKKVCRIHGLHAKHGKADGVTNIDLCPKCRKDFERFMKNEHDSSN